jgi:hypothetical protein
MYSVEDFRSKLRLTRRYYASQPLELGIMHQAHGAVIREQLAGRWTDQCPLQTLTEYV